MKTTVKLVTDVCWVVEYEDTPVRRAQGRGQHRVTTQSELSQAGEQITVPVLRLPGDNYQGSVSLTFSFISLVFDRKTVNIKVKMNLM